jgi:hypothetical protein
MTKIKKEVEIEYPDCLICGDGILDGKEFFELRVGISLLTMHRGDGYATSGIGNENNYNFPITFHSLCLLREDGSETVFKKIKEEMAKLLDKRSERK